jgi:predicted nucleotidyltransferase
MNYKKTILNHEPRLERFLEELKKVPEIIGVMYFGSTATKSWDKYSDLDIDVVVEDANYNKFVKKIPKLLEWWGDVKLINQYKDSDEWYVFVGEDYLKIEIDPHKKSNLKSSFWFKQNRIVYDKKKILKEIYQKSKDFKKPELDHGSFVQLFLDLRNMFIYAVRHYSRGQKLSGVSELGNIGGQLFYYLGRIKGLEGWEHIRIAEKTLSKKEWNFLKISRCKSLQKLEVKRAIKANWAYMKYIEGLYQRTSGKKLNLKCNDKEILNLIGNTLK